MADANVPFWQRATGPLRRQAARFPFERAILMGLAAVVGLYGGIAAGLFATAIRFVQLVVFRGAEVASSLFGNGRVAWLRLFQTRLGAAHWHLEFVALAALLLIAAAALDAVGAKRLPMFEVHRIRAVALAAALVIGSGGSAGREGPVVHLGGAVASSLSRFLALPRSETSILLGAGAGAGIAASFQAPLAGSLFALEIVLADFDVRRFAPVVLACVTAVATSRALLGGGNELRPVAWSLKHPSEIAVYLLLGVVAGLCGLVYIRAIHAAEEPLGRLPLRPEMRATIRGLLVRLVGLPGPRALGTGIETMNAAPAGQLALRALGLGL